MPDTWKHGVETISFALKVDGRPHFMVMLARSGLVKRMGFASLASTQETMAVGHREGVFDAVIEAIPDQLKNHRGTHTADGQDGPRCQWRIEISSPNEVVSLDLIYHAASAGLPQAIARLVDMAEELTNEWYSREVQEQRSAPIDAASGPRDDSSGSVPSPAPSRARRILGVVLDFFLLGIPYAYLLYLLGPETSATLPLGAGLILFGIVEVVLLQLVRWSPGYWAFGISIAPGRAPAVDPRQLARESAATIFVGVLFLWSGIDAVSEWTFADLTPAPYFGLDLGGAVSTLITVALGALAVVAGLLILRTDVRGVWVGAAFVGISLMSVLLGEWELWQAWAENDFTTRRAAQGRPVSEEDVQSFVAMLRPLMFGTLVLLAGGLALCWNRFRSRESMKAVHAEPVA